MGSFPSGRMPIGAADQNRLPLKRRRLDNLEHDLPVHESLDLEIAGSVSSSSASALLGVVERQSQAVSLQFLLSDGWVLDVPMSTTLVEQLRQILGTIESAEAAQ